MSDPTRPNRRRFGLRWWAIRVVAVLVIALLVAAGSGYLFWTGRPTGWEQAQAGLAAMPADDQRAIATSLRDRTLTQVTDLRDTDPYEVRIGLDEANAWLAQRLRPWAQAQGQPIPPEVGTIAVWQEDRQLVFGAEVELDGVKQVFSVAAAHAVNEQGQVVVKLAGVRAGRVPLPVDALLDQLDLSSDPRTAQFLLYIDQALTGIILEPQKIDSSRAVAVKAVEVTDEAVVFTLQTRPQTDADSSTKPARPAWTCGPPRLPFLIMSDVTQPKRIVVGITGASGAVYAQRMVQLLVAAGVETHVVISPLGQRLLHDELGMEGVDPVTLAGVDANDAALDRVTIHNYRDVGAPIASGSFTHDGMIIVPCSSNTLGCIATGNAQNLMHRAAHVTLKERRRLVLVHRESPLSLIDARNIVTAIEAGAIIAPANPGFYMLPQKVEDLVDFIVGRTLDLVGVDHDLNIRWTTQLASLRASRR